MLNKNTICLGKRNGARYRELLRRDVPGQRGWGDPSRTGRFPSGNQGDDLTVDFAVIGTSCIGLSGGPAFEHNESFSFQVATHDSTETDRLWNAIVENGGQRVHAAQGQVGACRGRSRHALTAAIIDPDRAAARRALCKP